MGVYNLFSQPLFLSLSTALSFVIGCLVLYATLWRLRASLPQKLPYPPGPPESSLISGNANIIPTTKPWVTYAKWANEYGPILHCRVYNRHIIILSSIEDCIELFERRSGLYSDRPKAPILALMGWDFNTALMPYGARWRSHRRLFQQTFKRDASLAYRPDQTRKVIDLLHGLLTNPEDFIDHAKTFPAAIIMSVMYGYDISPKKDYFVTLAEDSVARLSQAFFIPRVSVIDAIPILRFLPSWFPGASFQDFAAKTRELTSQMKEAPLKYVENQIASGNIPNCLTADRLQICRSEKEYSTLQDFASMGYAAGAETTSVALETFFYAMAISSGAQQKAQDELDIVVGTARLPTFFDTQRYYLILVIDSVRKLVYATLGSTIIPNAWAIAHDPDNYKSPELFNPDRFLDSNGDLNDDNVEYIFGFGRRLCPGRHMAFDTLWLAVATILSTFIVEKKRDAFGKEIPISGEYTDSLASRPFPYVCSIIPRSDEAVRVILEATPQTSRL